MGMTLKKVWLTEQGGGDIFSLSLESMDPERDYRRVSSRELSFPAAPSPKHPLRHTMCVGLFDFHDLRMLRNEITALLRQYGED